MTLVDCPLITIGITCYNAQDTIRRAVASALAQTWNNRRIAIVDDCSNDDSWNILQDLARENPNLTLYRHERNRGYPAALNTLLSKAQGEFVVIFDDDDESEPERLRQQYERIITYEKTNPGARVLCYANRNVVRIGETEVCLVAGAIGRQPPEPHGSVVADHILGIAGQSAFCWGVFGSCTLMARRTVFDDVGAFDTSFRRCAEMDFAVRAAFADSHFISVDAPLVTQYKTAADDKSVDINFGYWLMLRRKHKVYLRSRRAYWGAIALLHMARHQNLGNGLGTWAWRVVAFVCLPLWLSLSRLQGRAAQQRMGE